jgi:choline kinase
VRALILAAGRGTRLGGNDLPKCLTRIGERTLLDRYLDFLDAKRIPVTIVVGHGAGHILRHVEARSAKPRFVLNERYTEGSILSLATGLTDLAVDQGMNPVRDPSEQDSLLLLDGDVAFSEVLLQNLATSSGDNALLVDIGTVFTDEQYMAGINQHRAVALRRGPVDGHEQQGEWVGFAKLSGETVSALRKAINAQIDRGETSGGYEDALAGLLGAHRFEVVATNGEPWVEIDFPDDLTRARDLFAES